MNDDVPATFDDGSTTKIVNGVGTYTVAADGTGVQPWFQKIYWNCSSSDGCSRR